MALKKYLENMIESFNQTLDELQCKVEAEIFVSQYRSSRIAELGEEISRMTEDRELNYVRKSDVVEALKSAPPHTLKAFANIGITLRNNQATK
jgi:hypothetical protein